MINRNFYRTVLVLSLFVLYQCCSNSFSPSAPYKTVTVVYGLLNLKDTVHYIKIEKSFLSENGGNAYTQAQVADSIYYPPETVNASLEAFNNGIMINTVPLTHVDDATIGLNKDTGIFATTPNIIYYTKAVLNAAYTYTLVINNTKTGQITTAETNLVDSFFITSPPTGIDVNFDSTSFPTTASWYRGVNAKLYQLVVRFHYTEFNAATPNDTTQHTLTWVFSADTGDGGNTISEDIPGKSFYRFVASQIPVNTSVERRALSLDFCVYAAGAQLYAYQLVNVANSTNLVYGTTNPYYTDITNGTGLFSSVFIEKKNGLFIAPPTIDSLAFSSITRQLNFLDIYDKPRH